MAGGGCCGPPVRNERMRGLEREGGCGWLWALSWILINVLQGLLVKFVGAW